MKYALVIPLLATLSATAVVYADAARQAPSPAKAEVTALPPTGKGLEMVKPYRSEPPVPQRPVQDRSTGVARDRVNTPYSREIVTPAYRYGSPGYRPDGRGGRGYDFGYPGYRDTGGGGYPHHRQSINRSGIR